MSEGAPDGMPNVRLPAWIEVLQELNAELREAYAALGIEISPEEQNRKTRECLDEIWRHYFAHHMFGAWELTGPQHIEEDDE